MNRLTEDFKQTEEYEEVLGADAFPHRARGKAGRPLSTDKKIQMNYTVLKITRRILSTWPDSMD